MTTAEQTSSDSSLEAASQETSLFEQALTRYQQGAPLEEVIDSFLQITRQIGRAHV